MNKDPNLESAYALEGADAVESLYDSWAPTYDDGFAKASGYQLHECVAEAYVAAGGGGIVLDVGAGTGLVGEALAQRGITSIHGTDLSQSMLDVASAKGCYSAVFAADITQPLSVEDQRYGGVVSAGTFTLGHLGPEPLRELLRVVRPGGLFLISVNAVHWREADFAPFFETIASAITDLQRIPTRIYAEGASHYHADDEGYLVSFRVKA